MAERGPDDCLEEILALPGEIRWSIERACAIKGVTAYVVHSFDRTALLFSVPVLIHRSLPEEIPLDIRGAAGAVTMIIEQVKQKAPSEPGLGPLAGRGTRFPHQVASITEPYTLVASPAALASDLWHADCRNYADRNGIHLLLHGAVPAPVEFSPGSITTIIETVTNLCTSVTAIAFSVPTRDLEAAWIGTLDQELLREALPSLGLVSFVGDGSRLARQYTRYRPFFRTAGPRQDVNIPFTCPFDLEPVEIELPASYRTLTGLGIRRREVFAVAGSNAQGKTTFLDGIRTGMDDHAVGDGRENVVTVSGLHTAEATTCLMTGADISMFFSALPPGIKGTPRAASGMGSGSMNMASQVQRAVERGAPLLIIDEDRAAPNLLVRSCLQTGEITPLSEILASNRGKMGETALVFAACAMDILAAQADRIMVLDRHVASAVDRGSFREKVAESLRKIASDLKKERV
ncbi:MAG TPA: ABC-ATPase domain-containing protein [Methanoregulaceae archaeon]|nr:ABC-ATPase domain-containing protein [Methanoregulaceae archaeon]HQN89575.1 ABC-ATPase domain-containing protein [Methanoregulaceae archaeon]HQP82312.1 ABC-ATPase domain-containing protein [Methanoregulaceae archaeon]